MRVRRRANSLVATRTNSSKIPRLWAEFVIACLVLFALSGTSGLEIAEASCPRDSCNFACATTWGASNIHWYDSQMPIRYYINKDGASSCTGDEFGAIRRAASNWETLHGTFWSVCYVDTSSRHSTAHLNSCNSTPVQHDSVNVVSWEDMGSGNPLPLGCGWVWYSSGSDSIIEGDVTLNNNAAVQWSALKADSCIADKFDVENMATHEFGHWMTLYHSCDTSATMYCWAKKGEIQKRFPGDCDRTAMQYRYTHYAGTPKKQPGCWPFYFASAVATSPALGDINRDGRQEIVFGDADGLMHVITSEPAEMTSWPDSSAMGSGYCGSHALGDINGDGWLEIIFATQNGKVYAIDHNAKDLPGWPRNVHVYMTTPAIGDIDKDGIMEVVGAGSDSVYAWNGDGTPVPGWPVGPGADFSGSKAGLADLDGDDSLEVVVPAFNNKVFAFKPHGANLPGWPVTTGDNPYGPPAIGDIDADGQFEIVVPSYYDSLYAWNANGSRCTGWPIRFLTGSGENCCTVPSLGNIDSDNALEVLIGSRRDSVYAFNGDGSRVTGWPVYVKGLSQGSPLVLDSDNDASMEVIVVGVGDVDLNTKVYAFNGNGSPMSGWPVDVGSTYLVSAVAGDVNGDQETEVVVAYDGDDVYPIHLGTLEADGVYQWSTYGHDNHRTCRYGYFPPEVEPIVFTDLIADLGHWETAYGGGGYAGQNTNSYSPPYSLGILGGPSPGNFASAYSEQIALDFERTYNMSFYFNHNGFAQAKWFVFGHARLYLQSPALPLMYDAVGDWSALTAIGPPVSTYLPPGTWKKVQIDVNPTTRTYEIRVGTTFVGVASYQETVVPSNRIWFSDDYSLNSELYGYYDDFEVRGYLPVIGVPHASPPRALAENVLYQSFPNPMNPIATIKYSIKESGRVALRIYDVAGRVIKELVNEEKQASPIPYSVVWNGTDNSGHRVASGVYFCQMEAKSFVSTKKIVILR